MLRYSANENAIRNALSQSLLFPVPLDKGNVDSGNEIARKDDAARLRDVASPLVLSLPSSTKEEREAWERGCMVDDFREGDLQVSRK